MRLVPLFVAGLLLLSTPTLWAAEAQPFDFAGIEVEPGSRADLNLRVAPRGEEPGTFVPVTVLHGRVAGPVLATVSGIHGYEFAPILAADRLADRIDPAVLKGTVVIVRVANVPAFEARSPFVNPVDDLNLNRSFPGASDGSLTERIAAVLSSQVVARADFLMDIHSGDGAEFLDGFVGAYAGPLATDYALGLAVARGFGFPNIVRYTMSTQAQVDTGRSLNRQGVAAGIPTVIVEIGQNGSREEAHVVAITRGVENALGVLGLWNQPPHEVPETQRFFDGTTSVRANHSGLYFPAVVSGRYLSEGDLIGSIRDYSGREVEKIYSPVDGYALYGIQGPPVRAGDSVVTIALPQSR